MMRAAGDGADGARLRALIVILWRAGLRIGEALDLAETDLDASRGAVLVRRGKGGRRREVGMDRWAWSQLEPWMSVRRRLPVGALLCVIRGATAGRHWESSSARKQLGRTAVTAGVRRRFAPHQLRRAHAVEMAHEGVPLVVIQRQHANLGITSIYLQGIDSSAIKSTPSTRDRLLWSQPPPASDRGSKSHKGRVGDRPTAHFPRLSGRSPSATRCTAQRERGFSSGGGAAPLAQWWRSEGRWWDLHATAPVFCAKTVAGVDADALLRIEHRHSSWASSPRGWGGRRSTGRTNLWS